MGYLEDAQQAPIQLVKIMFVLFLLKKACSEARDTGATCNYFRIFKGLEIEMINRKMQQT